MYDASSQITQTQVLVQRPAPATQPVSARRLQMPRHLPIGTLTVRPSTFSQAEPQLLIMTPDLKYDNCNIPSNWTDQYNFCVADSDDYGANPDGTCPGLGNQAPSDYDWSQSNTAKRFNIMRDALAAVEDQRIILFSLCEWGTADVNSWGNQTGSSWRVSGDINRE